jgi:hypothetical protein
MIQRHRNRCARRPVLLLLLLGLGLAGPAQAGDGAIEINEARALAGGINSDTVTDPPGYPVVISEPGSYVLTGNLNVDASTIAIQIIASDVTVDFNGFGIFGPGTSGGGNGVFASGIRSSILNGFVRGVGDEGIRVFFDSRVERMAVSGCGGAGISAGSGSLVIANRVSENQGGGLVLDPEAGFVENVMTVNTGGPAVDGGKSLGGNLCDGQPCTSPPRRRFYLTKTTTHNGADALTACAPGFHMASLWEIWDPSALDYDTVLGQTTADSGEGPPANEEGWVRTGSTTSGPSTPGRENCLAWTSSNAGDQGTATGLPNDWGVSAQVASPWVGLLAPCDFSTAVWCAAD